MLQTDQAISRVTEKRLRNELKDLKKNKLEFAQAVQDESDNFLFYFLLRGDDDSDYKGGYYIGKIMLPHSFPENPGDFMMLTPNGRFTPDAKICLTNSAYHKENWTPSWTIKSMLIGFLSVFLSDAEHGISHIKESPAVRRKYAQKSVEFNLTKYNKIFKQFDQFVNPDGSLKSGDEIKQCIKDSEKPKIKNNESVVNEPTKKNIDHKNNVNNVASKQDIKLKKTKTEKLSELFKVISAMKINKLDVKPFEEVYNLISHNLSQL